MKNKMSNSEEVFEYYEVLDISRTATAADIKKAYKKQALKWHPDKNVDDKENAEKKFKQIAEAYEVLSDKDKRITYDRYGREGLLGQGEGRSAHFNFDHSGFHDFHHFRDPRDIFAEFFGGNDPFADLFGQQHAGAGFHPAADAYQYESSFPGYSQRPRSTHHSRHRQRASPFGTFSAFGGFGGMGGFGHDAFSDNFFGSTGGSRRSRSRLPLIFSFHTSSNFGGGAPSANFRSSSTSTKFVNGKKITTKKVVENGRESVTVEEDGVEISKKINGEEQLERLEYH